MCDAVIIITSVNLSDSCLGWLYIFDNLLFIMIIVTVTVIVIIIIIYELIALWLVSIPHNSNIVWQ